MSGMDLENKPVVATARTPCFCLPREGDRVTSSLCTRPLLAVPHLIVGQKKQFTEERSRNVIRCFIFDPAQTSALRLHSPDLVPRHAASRIGAHKVVPMK
jgi:hypothetical protein